MVNFYAIACKSATGEDLYFGTMADDHGSTIHVFIANPNFAGCYTHGKPSHDVDYLKAIIQTSHNPEFKKINASTIHVIDDAQVKHDIQNWLKPVDVAIIKVY